MVEILMSILTASSFGLLFKYFEKKKLDSFQAILVNYITAAVVGIITIGKIPFTAETIHQPWFPYAAGLGAVFFYSFYLIAVSISQAGISATMVAAKMSLVIPTFAGIWLYSEGLGWMKIAGIMLALGSLVFTLSKPKGEGEEVKGQLLMPIIIFIVAGLQDTVFGFTQRNYLNDANFEEFTIAVFLCAFVSGLLVTAVKVAQKQISFHGPSVLGGIALGIPNYFSVYFLVQALSLPGMGTSVIFPVMNIGIVAFSAIAALLLFKEKLYTQNWFGVLLALLAIGMISRG